MKAIKINDSKDINAKSILETFFINAERLQDKTALIAEDKPISYQALRKLSLGVKSYLASMGIGPGDKVIIKALPATSYIAGLFGTALCGAISVPLEKTMPEAGVKDISERLGAKLSIVNYEVESSDALTLKQLLERSASITLPDEDEIEFPDIDSGAMIMYTTGTTGKSKGVELTHRNILAAVQNTLGTTGMHENDVNLIPAPVNHSFGLRRSLGSLYTGGTLVLINGVTSVRSFFNTLDAWKATTITSVPTAMEYIFRMSGDMLGKYKDQLRYIEVGAEMVPNRLKQKLLDLLPHSDIFNTYGSSEAGCVTGINYRSNLEKMNSIGRDSVNAEIFFTDENHSIITADGPNNGGFITIKGPMVMTGYVEDEELTASVLDNGILYTNDIGYRDSEGFIFLLGRKGDVINVGGNKVSPSEVEEAANRHPCVAESACVPCKDPNGLLAQVPKLFVVVAEGRKFDPSGLKEYLTSQLEPYKVPVIYETITKLPKTYNLKLQRHKLY